MRLQNKIIGISLILLISLGYTSFSQNIYRNDSTKFRTPFEGNYIKFSPATLIELEPGLQFGYEYSVSPRLRLQHEIAYISLFNPVYQLFNWNIDMQNISSAGFKIRTTAKFPLKVDYYSARNNYKYLGIDVMLKYLSVTERDVSIRKLDAYWEMMDVESKKSVLAIHFLYGINNYLSYSNNIISDWYVGIGLRYKYLSDNLGTNIGNQNRPFYDDATGVILSLMGGFKLGFGN